MMKFHRNTSGWNGSISRKILISDIVMAQIIAAMVPQRRLITTAGMMQTIIKSGQNDNGEVTINLSVTIPAKSAQLVRMVIQ